MQPLDLVIIVLFLVGTAAYGFLSGRRNRTAEDYFLGGRTLPWPVAMLSIVATETSVLTFISIPGLAYRKDWFFLQLALGYILGRILVAWILLPLYFRGHIGSIYEVLGQRFGASVQKTASAVFLVTRLLADGIRFLATAVVVQVITGWPLWVAVIVIGLVTLSYTLLGGLRTVVWMDSFQFGLYLGGGLIAIGFVLAHQTVPWSELAAAGKFKIFHGGWDLLHNPWTFISAVVGGMFLSFASHGADYMMVQRILGCRNLSAARKAMVGSGIFVFFQFMVFLLAGTLIAVYFDNAPLAKDREFSTFIVQVLPVGLKGFLLAGVLSAAMSTLSSSINSLASSTIMDWFRKGRSLKRSRQASLFWAVLLILIALAFNENDKAIVVVGLQIASFTYGGLLGLFLLSFSRRPLRPLSLSVGLVGSMLAVFGFKFLGLAWTWYIAAAVVVNILVSYLVDWGLVRLRLARKNSY